MGMPYGILWEPTYFHPEPTWSPTETPNLDAIKSLALRHLDIPPEPTPDVIVVYLTEGAFNKIYKITVLGQHYIFRVALPVDPDKVACEVATMDLVRQRVSIRLEVSDQKTTIPVPRVLASDTSSMNELRFPWMLMQYIPGRTLFETWRRMPMANKTALTLQLAGYQAQLYPIRFDSIGSLTPSVTSYPTSDNCSISPRTAHPPLSPQHKPMSRDFEPGRLTSVMHLSALEEGIRFGPFSNTFHWLNARLLRLIAHNQRQIIAARSAEKVDEDDLEDLENNLSSARLMLLHLPRVFSEDAIDAVEDTVMHHHDIRQPNIMVDESVNITSILDWEHVSTKPLWAATRFPQVLMSRRRGLKPKRETYAKAESFYLNEPERYGDLDGVSLLYWEAKDEYEQTILREVYAEEMERLVPDWRERYEATKFEREFEGTIDQLEFGMGAHAGWLKGWLEAYDGNGLPRGDRWPQAKEDTWVMFGEPEYWPVDSDAEDDQGGGSEDEDDDQGEAHRSEGELSNGGREGVSGNPAADTGGEDGAAQGEVDEVDAGDSSTNLGEADISTVSGSGTQDTA